MYSKLDNIFHTHNQVRQTETLDTRLGIDHHNDDGRRRKQKKKEDEDDTALWGDDGTSLSVLGLRAFLRGLLKQSEAQQDTSDETTPKADDETATNDTTNQGDHTHNSTTQNADKADGINTPDSENTAQNNPAAVAASAYQRTYETVHPESVPEPDIAVSATDQDIPPLSEQDKDIIKSLLQDLRKLSANHVEYLRVDQKSGDSFVENLIKAVREALHGSS